jgi:ABC-type transport system involved in multi-copper enzyme maturation permease subunit
MQKTTETAQVIKMLVGNPFSFPEVWHTVAFFSSLFIFIPAVVIIMLITNEYSYRTLRQNIVDGWSRSQFIASKLIDVFIITLLITLLYVVVCIIIGSINSKAGADIFSLSYYTGLFALQTFAQLSIAFLIGFLPAFRVSVPGTYSCTAAHMGPRRGLP